MGDKFNENYNFESFAEAIKPLLEMAKNVSEQISPFMEQWSIIQKQLNDSFQRVSSIMDDYKLTFSPERMESFKRFGKITTAIKALAKAQYVIWEFYSDEFIDLIYSSKNVNKAILEFHVKNKFAIFKETIDNCCDKLSKRELVLCQEKVQIKMRIHFSPLNLPKVNRIFALPDIAFQSH
jgi:hypothetical protein